MARPSEYDPNRDYLKLAEAYLENCGREQTKLPKLSEYCREYIGKSEDAVNNWAKDETRKGLIGAIKRVKEAQMEQLMDDGLYGGKEVNNAMAIFLLKANHGLIETDRLKVEGENVMINLPTKYANNGLSGNGQLPAKTAGGLESAL